MNHLDDREHWLREELRHFRNDLGALIRISFVVWIVGAAIALVGRWERAPGFIVGLLILLIGLLPLMHLRTEHVPNAGKIGRWIVFFLLGMAWLVVTLMLAGLVAAIGYAISR